MLAFFLACQDPAPNTKTDIPSDDSATLTDEGYPCGSLDGEVQWCGSCAAIQRAWPDAPSGLHTIQPLETPFQVYCDLDRDGEGWTLLATNGWGGAWTEDAILSAGGFGDPALDGDHRSTAFAEMPFVDLLFETDEEYAIYEGVGDSHASYFAFQAAVPLHNCGVETEWEWPMTEGTLADPDLCSTNLYIHPIDWEGGLLPCSDSEIATGPAWSIQNKDLGCPLNDPQGSTFIADPWDLNPWGDHDPAQPNRPLRMWAR